MTRKKRACILLAAACIAVIGFTPGPATGTVKQEKPSPQSAGRPAGLSAEDEETMNRQIPMIPVATELRNLAERGGYAGFAGLRVPASGLQLWWKGQLPKPMRDAVNRAKVPVEVRTAAYSKKELKAAAHKLWKSSDVKDGGSIHAITMPFDGSGLEASVLPGGRSRSLAAIKQLDVPVRVVERQPMKHLYGRCNDSAPWYGGGATYNASYGNGDSAPCAGDGSRRYHCSTSFSVRIGDTPYMLTAGHCGAPGNVFRNTSTGGVIGHATHEHVDHDLMLIRTGLAANRIWDGNPGQQDYSKQVVAYGWAVGDQELCHTGATTGTGCGTKVVGSYVGPPTCSNDLWGPLECYTDMIEAVGGASPAPGDSGGGWWTRANSNDPSWSQAVAIGSISGIIGSNRHIFQDFVTATIDFPGLRPIL